MYYGSGNYEATEIQYAQQDRGRYSSKSDMPNRIEEDIRLRKTKDRIMSDFYITVDLN